MAISGKKGRVMVTLSNEMIAAMDEYCEMVGLSRSQYIAGLVGQSLYALNKVTASVGTVLQEAIERERTKE